MHVYENIQKYTCIRYRCVPKYTNKSHTHISIYIFVYKHVLHSLYFAPRVDKYILHLSTRRIHMYICLPNQVCVRHFQFKETTLQNTHTTNTHPNKYICTYTYEYAYIHIYEQECAFAMWGLLCADSQVYPHTKLNFVMWGLETTLDQTCCDIDCRSAMCVQNFDDSLSCAIRITYRSSQRSSSLHEPRDPSLKVVSFQNKNQAFLPFAPLRKFIVWYMHIDRHVNIHTHKYIMKCIYACIYTHAS